MQIEMNEELLKAQLALNDLAVKAGGLQVAEAAVVLSKIYQSALNKKDEPAVINDESK